jgi:hypothetical protein
VTGRKGIARILMLSTIAMTRGGPAPAADWSETLDASATVAYDTNPALLPGSTIADRAAQLALDGNTQRATELSQLTVTPRFAIIRYDEEKNLDVTTGSLALGYQDKGERGQWNASALAQTDSTLTSELGQTGITNVNFRHDAYSASLGYQYLSTERLSWSLQGFGQITRYNSDAERYGLVGYGFSGIRFGPTWSFSDRLQGSLSVETDRVSAQNGTAERDYSASTQLKRSLSEKYSWRISAGATRVEVPGSPGMPTSGVFELGATRQGERVQWDLSVKRAVLPIGFGLLAREDLAALSAVVTLSERSTLNLSGNLIRTDPVSLSLYLAPGISLNYQVYGGATFGQATAEWQYHFSPQWALSAEYMRARARNYSVSEWGNGNQARLGVVWQSGRL